MIGAAMITVEERLMISSKRLAGSKRLFGVALALSLGSLVACSSRSGGNDAPIASPQVPGLTLKTGFTSQSISNAMLHSLANPAAAIAPATLEFDFGIAGNQGGTLVAGYSQLPYQFVPNTVDAHTVSFDPTTIDPNTGATIGANGVSESFLPTDPSIITPTALTGPATFNAYANGGDGQATPGIFMARFAAAASTTMTLTPESTSLTQVDEVVLRLANPQNPLVDASGHTANIICDPHFFASGTRYSADDGNLSVGGTATGPSGVGNIQFIFFVPSSMIGANANRVVVGPNTVIDPVTNDLVAPGSWTMNPPKLWLAKDTTSWINDPGCAGLSAAITSFITNWPAAQGNPPAFATLATYFQNYFIKFYAANSTMFNNPGLLDGTGLGILGNTGTSASFEIIALDNANGPMSLSGNYTINLVFDLDSNSYDLTASTLNLAGNPPIKFTTSIVSNSKN
jgi:hypothetical protein